MSKYEDAAEMLADLDPNEARALVLRQRIVKARREEQVKDHPMKEHRLSDTDWAALKAYIMDGGGVEEDHDLATDLLEAVYNDDQKIFWGELMHLVKARAKIHGRMRALPFGGVSFTGIGERPNASRETIPPVSDASGERNQGEEDDERH